MNRGLMWRGLLILGLVVVSVLSMLPFKEKLNLGLDLRGGMHLELRVKTEDAVRAEGDQDMERLRVELAKKGVTATTERIDDTSFSVAGVAVDRDSDVGAVASDYLPGWNWQRQGDRLILRMTAQNESAIRDQAVNQAVQTIRNRVDEFGVGENQVARKGLGSDRIVAQLPGVDDPERIKRNIKNTAFLEFRLVDYPPPPADGAPSQDAVLANYRGALPSHVEIMPRDLRDRQGRVTGQAFYAVEKNRVITGRELKTARAGFGEFNQPVVNFQLTAEGGRLFGRATGENIGRGLAIILDGKVVSAPRINSRIADAGLIEGGFNQQEVEDLSAVLRSGALPAGIVYLEERTVGPTLGQDSIRSGLQAGAIAALLTVLSMFVVYKATGLNAVAALALNVVLVFGALAYFHATLTLPGIAGIILTVAMAFDANVLVFERIREELRLGKSVKSSIEAGFSKAMSSILDSNLTTLIAALFLFQFGTGPVRGFAVTLSIGILATLVAGVFFSRWLFGVTVLRRERVERLSI